MKKETELFGQLFQTLEKKEGIKALLKGKKGER